MTRGRKPKNHKSGIRAFNCADSIAWKICKKKKINISLELTRHIQRIAYSNEDLHLAEKVTLDMIHSLQDERIREIDKIESKYEYLLRTEVKRLQEIQTRIGHKEADKRLK